MLIHARPNCAEWNILCDTILGMFSTTFIPDDAILSHFCHSPSLSLYLCLSVSHSICSSYTSLWYSFSLPPSLCLFISQSLNLSPPISLLFYYFSFPTFLPLSLHISLCSFAFFSPSISLSCEYLSPSHTSPTFIIPSSSGRWMVSRFSLLVTWTHGLEHRELEAKVLHLPSH